jgi:hypothetical protein
MPIVIEEMTVQVEVNDKAQNMNVPVASGQSASGPAGSPQTNLIKACIDEVMEVLRHQNER